MKRILFALFLFSAPFCFALDPGQKAPDFAFKDTSGKDVKLSELSGKNVVLVFVSTRCPYSNAFNKVMAQLAADYSSKGVVFVGINSNNTEAVEEVAQHANTQKFPFPVLKDTKNKIADFYGAQVTPEAFVIDQTGTIRYHGALGASARPTTDAAKANSDEIRAALNELLQGRQIAKTKTKAFGCTIKRVS